MGEECLWRVEGQSRGNTFFVIMMENIFCYHDRTLFFSLDDNGGDHDGEDDVSRYEDGEW